MRKPVDILRKWSVGLIGPVDKDYLIGRTMKNGNGRAIVLPVD